MQKKPISSNRAVRILVAEDDPVEQVVTTRLLTSHWSAQVTVVGDGTAAVRAAVSETWDVVLMDLGMPSLDGFKATRRIRSFEERHPDRQRLPIIAYTGGNPASIDDEELKQSGLDEVLFKPANASQMERCLNRWLPRPLVRSAAGEPGA